ncbi:MAG TPA: acetolactate synthase small subunit [Humidesulfovibrio sp.]|uniref:acetolactate synthase small subunit n=1 Tax=Humidesulfovibrio sp. TaxID=2910988 RepID=UPI002B6393A9|nr:acetolactate synthase small subunit [Humidesulfovibrio sp.]HWR04867.1 acetolactate synthase small subunit [Humidesulfovibrio sp.]
MKHTISALVANRSGVLADMAEEFKRRGLNIRSISSGETENPEVSRMVICFESPNGLNGALNGDDTSDVIEAVGRMAFVIQVDDLSRREFVDRELVLMKIQRDCESLSQLMQILEVFRAGVVGLGEKSITIELSGDSERVEGLIRMLTPFGVLSMARTGKIALKRGDE